MKYAYSFYGPKELDSFPCGEFEHDRKTDGSIQKKIEELVEDREISQVHYVDEHLVWVKNIETGAIQKFTVEVESIRTYSAWRSEGVPAE